MCERRRLKCEQDAFKERSKDLDACARDGGYDIPESSGELRRKEARLERVKQELDRTKEKVERDKTRLRQYKRDIEQQFDAIRQEKENVRRLQKQYKNKLAELTIRGG